MTVYIHSIGVEKMEYGNKEPKKEAGNIKEPRIKGFLYTIINPETGGLAYSTDLIYTEKKALQGYNIFCRMYVLPDITIMCHNGSC